MNHDEGNGSQVDVRLRRAARSFRSVAAQLRPHAAADLERFERFRARKLRSERRAALIVAALIALVIATILVRWQPRGGTPVGPPSPSNGRVVFGRSAPGLDQRSLFVVDPDGSHEQRLPITYTDCGEWSPDGSRLHVTASQYPGTPLRPAVVGADGSDFRILDTSASADLSLGCGDWSPNGTRLVLEGFGPSPAMRGIYAVNAADGAGLVQLTHGDDTVPQYSPDGAAIVFQRTAGSGGEGRGAALFVVDADGSNLRRITPWGLARSAGGWGPAGRIVFAGPADSLWTVAADGGDAVPIPATLGGRPFQPRWSPDGGTIVFGLRSGGQTDIYTVRPDGSGLTRITDTPTADEWWPDWGVG